MPYENSKLMHQFYRDILCDDIRLPEFGNVPPEWVRNFINARSYNVLLKAEQVHKLNTGLAPSRDRALKLMLTTLEQSKLASDYFAQGMSVKLPRAYVDSILDTLHEILKLNPNVNYFVTGLQLMYRIGAIDEFMAAVSRYPDLPPQFSSVAIIKAMIHMMEGEFDAARDLLKTTDPKSDRNSIVQLMRMTCEFKLGGTPRSLIDFRLCKMQISAWCRARRSNGCDRPTEKVDRYQRWSSLATRLGKVSRRVCLCTARRSRPEVFVGGRPLCEA